MAALDSPLNAGTRAFVFLGGFNSGRSDRVKEAGEMSWAASADFVVNGAARRSWQDQNLVLSWTGQPGPRRCSVVGSPCGPWNLTRFCWSCRPDAALRAVPDAATRSA